MKKEVGKIIALAILLVMAVALLIFQESILTAWVPSGLSSGPILVFEAPTPANNALAEVYPNPRGVENFVEVNISIDEDDLDSFLFNWNGLNYNFYDDSLRRAYSFDNNPVFGETSNNFYDFSPYTRNAGCSGDSCPTIVPGKYGSALHFDGVNDMVNCIADSSLVSSVGTVSFWAKLDGPQDTVWRSALMVRGADRYKDFLTITFNGRDLWVHGEKDGIRVMTASALEEAINIGEWHHIVISQDGTGIRFFVNGIERKIIGGDNPDFWFDDFDIQGCEIGSGWSNFRGSIDEFRIYSEPWTNETLNCPGYGADMNPTGDQFGGGPGYSKTVSPGDADFIVSTGQELRNALSQASSGQIVYIDDNAEIRFSTSESLNLPINQGVTVASGRGRQISPGVYSEGALIHVYNDTIVSEATLFNPQENFRITGIRFRGPANTMLYLQREGSYYGGDRNYNDNSRVLMTPRSGEVDNCVFWEWGYAGVNFHGNARGYIHHNYFHDNQGRLGYHVVTGGTANNLIEANFMEGAGSFNSAGGSPGCSYEARYNYYGYRTECGSHQLDMHGSTDYEQPYKVSHWRFDDPLYYTNPSQARDTALYNSGGHETGTLTNMDTATAWTSDVAYEHFFYSLQFDGANDYVDFGNNADLNDPITMNNEITLEAFIKTTAVPENRNQIIAIKGTLSNPSYYLYLNGDTDTIDFSIGNNRVVSMAMPSGLQNQWHHIAGTYNGNTLGIWYDGELMNSVSASGIITSNSQSFTVGAEAGGSRTFQGMIDEVTIYNRDLGMRTGYLHCGNNCLGLHAQGYALYAGERMNVHHNTITTWDCIGSIVRGIPTDRSVIHHNKFYQTNHSFFSVDDYRYWSTSQVVVAYQRHGAGNMYVFDNCIHPLHRLATSNLKKVNQDTWNFYFNAARPESVNYPYYAWAEDTLGNANYAYGRNDEIIYTPGNPRRVNVKNSITPNVTLISPSHGSSDSDGSVTFTCNVKDNVAIENVTLQVLRDGQTYYSNYQNIEGLYYNRYDKTLSWQLTSMPQGTYTWNCRANNVGYYSDWATNSYVLTVGQGPPSPDTTPPYFTDIYNVEIYDNQSVAVDFDAQDNVAVSTFSVNDNRFSISSSGYLRNVTTLSIMKYWLTITVYDTSNNQASEVIFVNVSDSFIPDITPPHFTNIANLSIYNNQSVAIDLDAEDNIAISTFSVNDSRFSISSSGYLRNTSSLAVRTYWLNITAYDTSDNQASTTIFVSVSDSYSSPPIPQDTTPPYFTDINDITVYQNVGVSYDIDAVDDESVVDCFTVDDTRFSIDCDGLLTNAIALELMTYLLNITINDTSNNLNSSIMYVNVVSAPPPEPPENGGGGGGGAPPPSSTTPGESSNVLPPLIQPQAPEPGQEQEPQEGLKGEESFFESLLFKEGKIRWEAILVITITMMIIIYAVFYLSMQPKKI